MILGSLTLKKCGESSEIGTKDVVRCTLVATLCTAKQGYDVVWHSSVAKTRSGCITPYSSLSLNSQ